MAEPMAVDARPCSSCPYRLDTPPGVWAASEYEKLTAYAANEAFGVFLCHHSALGKAETVCRGWLTVEAESVAARIAVLRGQITDEQRYAPPAVPLYPTGQAARDAGIAAVERPDARAQAVAAQLYHRTWAGCMVPTDDVIAHLSMCRGDEAYFWKCANQHDPASPEAGL